MEIMVVVCILAVVASIALPSITSFHASQQASAAAKAFLSDVRRARYEAIRTGTPHRILLTQLSVANRYKVEMLNLDIETGITLADFNNASNWVSILDTDSAEIDPKVTISLADPSTIYFTPEGRATDNWILGATPVPMVPRLVHFCFGDAATMTIHLTTAGGLSSTEFYEESL